MLSFIVVGTITAATNTTATAPTTLCTLGRMTMKVVPSQGALERRKLVKSSCLGQALEVFLFVVVGFRVGPAVEMAQARFVGNDIRLGARAQAQIIRKSCRSTQAADFQRLVGSSSHICDHIKLLFISYSFASEIRMLLEKSTRTVRSSFWTRATAGS